MTSLLVRRRLVQRGRASAPRFGYPPSRGLVGAFGGSPAVQTHRERRLVRCSRDALYAVVSDIGHYQDFVPWCVRSRVLRQDSRRCEAELTVGFKMITESYTSRVSMRPGRHVRAVASDMSIFRHLVNEWEFEDGPHPDSCWVNFFVEFQFRNSLYSSVSGMFMDEVVHRMVRAFESRAQRLAAEDAVPTSGPAHAAVEGGGDGRLAPGPTPIPRVSGVAASSHALAGMPPSEVAKAHAMFDGRATGARADGTPVMTLDDYTAVAASLQAEVKRALEQRLRGPDGATLLAQVQGQSLHALAPADVQQLRLAAVVAARVLGTVEVRADDQAHVAKYQFRAMDRERRGALTFEEFASGLAVMLRGPAEERARFAFRCCDQDGDGYVTLRELRAFGRALARSQWRAVRDLHSLVQTARSDGAASSHRILASSSHAVREAVAAFLTRVARRALPTPGPGGEEGGAAGAELPPAASSEDALVSAVEQVVEAVMHTADGDGDGRVTYEEFRGSVLCRIDVDRLGLLSPTILDRV